ncbi:hypothetical protein GQ42DRAFT_85923 [Ramicandelaber brevisporus]|nr:hypothetical protein GQ42DRAFT_85923 [Ramicandelaber brevisporus]
MGSNRCECDCGYEGEYGCECGHTNGYLCELEVNCADYAACDSTMLDSGGRTTCWPGDVWALGGCEDGSECGCECACECSCGCSCECECECCCGATTGATTGASADADAGSCWYTGCCDGAAWNVYWLLLSGGE